MKRISLTIVFIFSALLLSAQASVQFFVHTTQLSPEKYELRFVVNVEKGWYVYAVDDLDNGITGIKSSFSCENVLQLSSLESENAASNAYDKLFSKSLSVYTGQVLLRQQIELKGKCTGNVKVHLTGFATGNQEFLPFDIVSDINIMQPSGSMPELRLASVDILSPISDCGGSLKQQGSGLLVLFGLGFLGGLIALLTPCVFPMVPVTVSFFLNKSTSNKRAISNALLYGFFILLIYSLTSIPFHLLGNINPEIFNTIATNTSINLFFFFIFLLFALSFFGLFNIQLPSWLTNAANSKSSINNVIGIFFMALTIAIVSFSCTGPILGSLLVTSLSSNGGAWQLTAGMAGFGLALGLPFALFALSPSLMKKIPKSGSWMETIKKTFAFIELALAIKFLSNADLVNQWGLLRREVFIGSWILIAFALALYLFNVKWLLKYGQVNVNPVRFGFGFLAFAFAIYMIPGITNSKSASLSLLSGFPPPMHYSIYKHEPNVNDIHPDIINDYDKALALAKRMNKPLMIDFTGWACVNCRKMEEHVWQEPEIKSLIKEKFILLSLYVDDRKKLPADQQFTYKMPDGIEKDIITVGDKYATMEAINFKQVTQPLYVLLSPDEKLLNSPVGYTPNVSQYLRWLECGLQAFNQQKTQP